MCQMSQKIVSWTDSAKGYCGLKSNPEEHTVGAQKGSKLEKKWRCQKDIQYAENVIEPSEV